MLDLHLELGILRAPPERLDGPGRVGNQLRRVSGPSRYHLRGNSTPGYPSRRFQHAFNGCPSAGSEVEPVRSEEHTSELQSPMYLVCRLLLEKKSALGWSKIHTSPEELDEGKAMLTLTKV